MRLPTRPPTANDRAARHESRGQSLVEFALFLPVLLLLLLVALDFGRVYLGWVNLQQMARVAANFAADNALDWPADVDRYNQMLHNESTLINCVPDESGWGPQYGSDISLGQLVTVDIDCDFTLITPIISQILGNSGVVTASASATYPIKDGIVGSIPGGGGPVTPAPNAAFSGTPLSGWAPLEVTFTDLTTGAPATWAWDFSTGTATGTTPTANPATASTIGPHTVTFDCGGAENETCTFSVELTVSNSGGSDAHTETAYVTVRVPPATGPLAEFTGDPLAGTEPLTVDFEFVDLRPGTATTWEWDFGDGVSTGPGTDSTPTHVYANEGDYDVSLTVTDGVGGSSTLVKASYVHVEHRICTVPDFQNKWRFPRGQDPGAQAIWASAGFSTTVNMLPNNQGQATSNYQIETQSITGGTIDPQPLGCDSTITVGP